MRGTDVAAMMTRVETTLAAAERAPGGAGGVLPVAPEGDAEVNVSVLRKQADIRTEFPPGSARPVVGAVVRLGKRTMRRAVKWYVTPMMEQQSRVNHALLDGIERLRVRIERLAAPASPAGADVSPGTTLVPGDRAVAVGPDAGLLAGVLAGGGAEVTAGDPIRGLQGHDPGTLDAVLADVTGMDAAGVLALLTAATSALRPGGAVVLAAADPSASLHPGSLAWALSASGFVDVATTTAPPPPPPVTPVDADLARRLAVVDAAARATAALVSARRTG